jgi:hypothetical protein
MSRGLSDNGPGGPLTMASGIVRYHPGHCQRLPGTLPATSRVIVREPPRHCRNPLPTRNQSSSCCAGHPCVTTCTTAYLCKLVPVRIHLYPMGSPYVHLHFLLYISVETVRPSPASNTTTSGSAPMANSASQVGRGAGADTLLSSDRKAGYSKTGCMNEANTRIL